MRLRWWRTRAETEQAILDYLREHGESRGLAVCKGAKVGRGVVYVYLSGLEDEGFVVSRYDPADEGVFVDSWVFGQFLARRRLYKLTGNGRRRLVEADSKSASAGLSALAGAVR